MKKIKNIIFDLDGTLWDSRKQILNAWKIALKEITTVKISDEELTKLMGKTNDEYKKILFPNTNDILASQYMLKCEVEEVKYLNKYGADIFENVIELIKQLKKNYNLFIVSNCQSGYIESFLNYYNLKEYFTDIECNGNTGLNKTQNIQLLINRNKIECKNTCYVGDTTGDYESSKNNNLLFIYAKYGFGKCKNMKYTINKITELPAVLENINLNS